ncbi:hypothetical protein RBE51_21365 [Pseudomonas taiwanensis]|uniref:hypothetical protein n=1 Tax=Pseudomonas taiwanensis TaxID=470150 RepID=UPI0028DFF90C|nr:hypothetical protein [Pseudomonas taiwanensis]MDT8925348.1 hypothetical protein [Pseudomonas taiwanensis]
MSNLRIDRLIDDFHQHCRGQATHDVDKLLGHLSVEIATVYGQQQAVMTVAISSTLETALLAIGSHRWENEGWVSDAASAYCDHFTPSIKLVNRLRDLSEDLLERMIDAHCVPSAGALRYATAVDYGSLLSHPRLPTYLAARLIDHLVTTCEQEDSVLNDFPLAHVLAKSAQYEHREILIQNEQAIVRLADRTSVGVRACSLTCGRKLWEYGVRRFAEEIFNGSDMIPCGEDLVWMRATLNRSPSDSWLERCWTSASAQPVEAVVRYYLEYEGIELPANEPVHQEHLCAALRLFADKPGVYTSERYIALLDHLVAHSKGVKRPAYEALPRKVLELSPLYMEQQLMRDLGI